MLLNLEPAIVSWSGGKDSMLALHTILNKKEYKIKTLFTSSSIEYDRVSIHGVRNEIIKKQARSIGLPIHLIHLPKNVDDNKYQLIMKGEMTRFISKGIFSVVFGDIFLEDVREYRESNLSKIGMKGIFPLWGKSSRNLARKFLDLRFNAIITSVDSTLLDGSFIGEIFNDEFISAIPKNVDPCGENGEFHTFVFDGPLFSHPIQFKKGKIICRENRFYYIDLI